MEARKRQAAALVAEGLLGPSDIAKAVGIARGSLYRWLKDPKFIADVKTESERLEAKAERLEQAEEEDLRSARKLSLERMEEQRQEAAIAFRRTLALVNDVLERKPRSDDTVKLKRLPDGESGEATLQTVEVVERPPVDEAATLASKLAAGGGLRWLADAAVAGPFVPQDAAPEKRDPAAAAEDWAVELERAVDEAADQAEANEAVTATG